MNPYQPPASEIRYPSFGKRFRHAVRRASAEYRQGLRQEQFSATEHIVSWIALLMLLLSAGLLMIAWLHFYFESAGVF